MQIFYVVCLCLISFISIFLWTLFTYSLIESVKGYDSKLHLKTLDDRESLRSFLFPNPLPYIIVTTRSISGWYKRHGASVHTVNAARLASMAWWASFATSITTCIYIYATLP